MGESPIFYANTEYCQCKQDCASTPKQMPVFNTADHEPSQASHTRIASCFLRYKFSVLLSLQLPYPITESFKEPPTILLQQLFFTVNTTNTRILSCLLCKLLLFAANSYSFLPCYCSPLSFCFLSLHIHCSLASVFLSFPPHPQHVDLSTAQFTPATYSFFLNTVSLLREMPSFPSTSCSILHVQKWSQFLV